MNQEEMKECRGISAGALKMIAVITMLIDHIAATVLVRYYYMTWNTDILPMYNIMRNIGRIAFPIYCFMLIEGLMRTRSRRNYLFRMGVFACISEIPFDLAFSSKVLETEYQNVFFTLTIGLAAMMLMEWIGEKVKHPMGRGGLCIGVAAAAMTLSWILKTDYSWRGVACILIMYAFRSHKKILLTAGYLAFLFLLGELTALPAFILLSFYQGKKGFSGKAFFYGFYPIHLLILYGICVLLKISSVPAI